MYRPRAEEQGTRRAVAGFVLLVTLAACGVSAPGANQGVSRSSVAPTSTGVVGPARGQAADIRASGLLGGNASPEVPAGEPGKVAVVVVGPVPTDQSVLYSVPIVIRNNTDKAVGRVAVTASALDAGGRPVPGLSRDTKGNLATVAYSQGFQPVSIEPGQAALGAVYFRAKSTIPVDATFEFTVETSEPGADRPYDSVSLKPTDANLAGGQVAGTAANTTGKPLEGPFEAHIFCFDASGRFSAAVVDYAGPPRLDTDGTAPFQVDVAAVPCTTFLVGVSTAFQIPPVTRPS